MTVAPAVSPFAYLPFAFFDFLTPVIAAVWAYSGIGRALLEPKGWRTQATAPAAEG